MRVTGVKIKGLRTAKDMRLWSQRSPGTVTARGNHKGALATVASGSSVTSLFRTKQEDPLRVFVDVPQPVYRQSDGVRRSTIIRRSST
jgi:hypothetical protein